MSEIIEFIVRGRDMLSGMFPKIGNAAQQTARNVDSTIQTTQQHLTELARPVRLSLDTTGLSNASREIDNLGSSLNGLSNTKLIGGMAIGQLVSGGIQSSMQFARQQITETLNAGLDASAQIAQFQVLAGQDKGGALFKELTKYIQDSVFGPELYKDARTLMAFGVAADDVMGTMKMLGDVSMGDAEKMQSLTLAFAQTQAAGKLMGQDLLQYVSAGFNPLQVIADHTGKKFADLRDQMSEGKITADMVRQAFVWATSEGGKFNGMLDKMAETPFGMKQAELGSVESAKMTAGMQELPAMTQVLKEFKPIIDDLPNTLAAVKPELDAVIYGFADMVKWVRTNTDTVKMWIGLIKVGAEAYVAWKVGTAVATAANWVWVTSLGGVTTAAGSANSAIAVQNAELAEQQAAIAALIPEYEALTVSISGMSAAEKEAALAAAANTANLGMSAGSLAAATRGGIVGGQSALAGGLMSGISGAVVPVAIAYFAGEALSQMISTSPLTGEGWNFSKVMKGAASGVSGVGVEGNDLALSIMKTFGYDPIGDAIAQAKAAANPVAGRWDMLKGFVKDQQPVDVLAQAMAVHAKGGSNGSSAVKDIAADITGGGKKQIIINVNHELVRQMITVGSKREADMKGLDSLEEQIFRILDTAAGAAGR